MSWSFCPALTGYPEHAGAWDQLNSRIYKGHPLFDSRFVGPLVSCFALPGDLLAIHRQDNGINGLVLLTRPRPGMWSTFMPSQTQVSPVLLARELRPEELLRELPGPVLTLDFPCQDPDYSGLSGAAAHALEESSPHALTVNISLAGVFEDYWQGRSKKLRQNVRRGLQKATEDGLTSRLEVVSDAPGLAAAFVRYGEMESRSWKAKTGTAIHPDNAQGQFYRAMLLGFASTGQAAFYELYLGGTLAATQMTISSESMLITLKTTYDQAFAAYSPGRLLDYLLLEREYAEQRHRFVEFYTNATPELLSWGTGSRTISHHRWYRHLWVRRLTDHWRTFRARRRRGDAATMGTPAESP